MTAPVPFDRLPPHDVRAEEAVLGVCLSDPAQAPSMLEIVKPRDFFREKNGAVLMAIATLYERDGTAAISRRAVAGELERMGRADEVGGPGYLAEVANGLETTAGGEYWAKCVAQAAFYRRTISVLSRLTDQAYRQPDDADGFMDDAVEGLLGLAVGERGGGIETARELLLSGGLGDWLIAHMEDPARLAGMSTGFPTLDGLLDGLQRGSVYIVAAETSAGKSLMAQNLVLEMAKARHRFLVISSEMTNRAVGKRIVFMEAMTDPQAMRQLNKPYDLATKNRVEDAMDTFGALPVSFWNPGGLTFAGIRGAVRKLRAKGGLDVLVIDHIDHVAGQSGNDRRAAELETLMRQVKALAEAEDIAVLAISHLSRSTGNGKVARLKNSSAKEQDADVLMFLQPVRWEDGSWVEMPLEEAQLAKARDNWLNVRLEVYKNREGLTGFVQLVMSWNQGGRYYEPARPGE